MNEELWGQRSCPRARDKREGAVQENQALLADTLSIVFAEGFL